MAKYRYNHETPTAFSITGGNDYHLHEGNEYELPEANAFVQSLVEQGRLTEIAEPSTASEPAQHAVKTSKTKEK